MRDLLMKDVSPKKRTPKASTENLVYAPVKQDIYVPYNSDLRVAHVYDKRARLIATDSYGLRIDVGSSFFTRG